MTLRNDIVHCLVDPEPKAFHDLDDSRAALAVNLGFECVTDVKRKELADKNANATAEAQRGKLKADEIEARKRFSRFVTQVQNVRLHLFKATDHPSKQGRFLLTHADASIEQVSDAWDPNAERQVVAWLSESRESRPSDEDPYYWTTLDEAAGAGVLVDAKAAPATYRLRAAQAWNAPVGHRLGLTHILRLEEPSNQAAVRGYVVLPFFGASGDDDLTFEPFDASNPSVGDVEYDAKGEMGQIVCRTVLLKPGTDFAVDPAQVSEFLTSGGYIRVDPHAEELWRVVRWFEVRAASLMAPALALAGPGKGDEAEGGASDDKQYDDLFPFQWITDDSQPAKTTLDAPMPAWLAAAGLCAALDNLVVGLLKPASGGASAGDVLGPFVLDLLEGVEGEFSDRFRVAPDELEPGKVAQVIRGILTDGSALMDQKGDPRRIREALCKVHQLDDPPKANATVETRLLHALLRHFVEGPGVEVDATLRNDIRGREEDGEMGREQAILRRALIEAEQRLQEEAGAETAIVRLIETCVADGEAVPDHVAKACAAAWKLTSPEAVTALTSLAEEAWDAFRERLAGPFNGAEAIRRASGSEFAKALLACAKPAEALTATPKQLIDKAIGADYYARRLLGPGEPEMCFGTIALALTRIDLSAAGARPEGLRPFLTRAYEAALRPMERLADDDAPFVPDRAPAPLPVQVAANMDGAEIDDFARHFNGVAMAIRRVDTEASRWAHANLAELSWPMLKPKVSGSGAGTSVPETTVKAAIHTLLPAASDGRAPMFIEYEGLPFAAAAFDAPTAEGKARLFYGHDAPDLQETAFAQIPRLAYGRRFEAFSFATTNAGTLPLTLQERADRPWMPEPKVKRPTDDGVITRASYQRRTAIGEMAIEELTPAGQPRRIDRPIEGVIPLAGDYPRVVITAAPGSRGVRDLFRERDGGGTMAIPAVGDETTTVEWRLSGVAFRGKPSRIRARLFEGPAKEPDDAGLGEAILDFPGDFDFGTADEIIVGLESVKVEPASGTEGWKRTLSLAHGALKGPPADLAGSAEEFRGWLRLLVESNEPASLSFARTDEVKPHEPEAPLLLLSPGGGAWKPGAPSTVTVQVATPRVGYLDFERWFANADLRREAFGIDDSEEGRKNAVRADNLRRALLAAYLLRDTDERTAQALDRLPDPAVTHVQVELAVQDHLDDLAGPPQPPRRTVPLEKAVLALAQDITVPNDGLWSPALLWKEVFERIHKRFCFRITIRADEHLDLSEPKQDGDALGLTAQVPAGAVARLSTDALVAGRHFEAQDPHPAVFHEGLRQHAGRTVKVQGSVGSFLAFHSAAIRVETMLDGMREVATTAVALAGKAIAVRPVERSRSYELRVEPEGLEGDQAWRLWRRLGEVDVTSQRWRPGGRPIYSHVDPREFASKPAPAAHPALPVALDEDGRLSRFEQEAFFDRPDFDSQTVTQRLAPLPSATVLQKHVWDAPSATYFRHRFTLRSRYAGALVAARDRDVRAWVDRETLPAHAWTMRVALLADLSRILLTRPQQRALIPLTSSPEGEDRLPVPPVLSVLQEPPFARGGLADRIAAEIKTGFGYGFEPPVEADGVQSDEQRWTVEILDARKEIGPDPRLDYAALDRQTALGLALATEGPIGLTFDPVNASAPAFPNSMLSLVPVQLRGKPRSLEEHFLGVSMRRYTDPNWTTSVPAHGDGGLDAERCWWIDCDNVPAGELLLGYEAVGSKVNLLTLAMEDRDFVVRTTKAAVDGGVKGTSQPEVAIARWAADGSAARLSILHQPIAPGRYSATVFAPPRSNKVAQGRSSAPLPLASFEWGPPPVEDKKPAAVTLRPRLGSSACPTMASAPTFLAWTRTGRNFDALHRPVFDDGKEPTLQVRAGELVSRWGEDRALGFAQSGVAGPVWLCSSTFRKPVPLHVHRHQAVIATRYLREPGRPIEEYLGAGLLLGATATLDADWEPDCVRVIEFESPAAILCGSDAAVPPTYKAAYFDLISTGFDPEERDAASARLFFRFVGSVAHLRKFRTLRIDLGRFEPGAQNVTWSDDIPPLNLSIPDGTAFAVGAMLRLDQQTDGLKAWLSALASDGSFGKEEKRKLKGDYLAKPDHANPGFFVRIAANGAQGDATVGEFWADVSLLHSPLPASRSRFDFEWLFPRSGGADPAMDVAPAGLGRMVEAQARIISVSPAISVSEGARGITATPF